MEIIKKNILQALTTGTTQGFWNAETNIPDLTALAKDGYMWQVTVSGTTILGNINVWNVGDWVVKYGEDDGWGKIVNGVRSLSGNTLIIPDFSKTYYMKILLENNNRDIGFLDAFEEPVIPIPPEPVIPPDETFYLLHSNSDIYTDDNDDKFTYK